MSRFLPYIHNLRGLAILFIVGVHVRGYPWNWEKNDKTYDFFVALFDNGTVLFVFIAGFLFQHLTHNNYTFVSYLKQKFKYVILPYIIISIPIILFRLIYGAHELPLSPEFDSYPAVYKFFYFLITGMHMAPFWFMPMIFLIYLTSPILHRLDNTKHLYSVVFPIILLAGFFTYRPLNNANPLLAYLHFLPIYITGMWASYYKEKILALEHKLLIPMAFVYLTLTTLELTGGITLNKKLSAEQIWDQGLIIFNVYVFKAVILCFILLYIFNRMGDKKIGWLYLLGEYSFGIYFIHYYIISAGRIFVEWMNYEFRLTWLSFAGFYVFVLIGSICAVYVIKKISGSFSRYVIGS